MVILKKTHSQSGRKIISDQALWDSYFLGTPLLVTDYLPKWGSYLSLIPYFLNFYHHI